MSTWILCPEPAAWLSPLLDAHPTARVFAPWALPVAPPRRLLGRLRRPWAARHIPLPARTLWIPGWQAAEAIQRRWEGGDVARRFRMLRARRHALDRLAAACIPEGRDIIAPTLAATVLRGRASHLTVVLDLPLLSLLHRDLDAAAAALPRSTFLNNYRAPHDAVMDQERELHAADAVLVRAPYTQAQLGGRAALLSPPPSPAPRRPLPSAPLLQLAGAATARNGTHAALALLERWPSARLRVRPTEGTEPTSLLDHPRVQTDGTPDAVLALSWCASAPPEVRAALADGIPVVATDRAALPGVAAIVSPGDVDAIESALRRGSRPTR